MGKYEVPGTIDGALIPHKVSKELKPGLDLSENLAAGTIDQFFAEKNVTFIHDLFKAQVNNYELFGPACDDEVRCVWIRNLFYVLYKYVDKSLRSQYE